MFVLRWDVIWPNAVQTLLTTLSGSPSASASASSWASHWAPRRLYKTIFPTLIGVNSIPKVAFVPLLVLWAGLGTVPAVMTSAIIVIFPVAVVVSASIATMDPAERRHRARSAQSQS